MVKETRDLMATVAKFWKKKLKNYLFFLFLHEKSDETEVEAEKNGI